MNNDKKLWTSRQRVMAGLNFQMPDRLPKDLGGMASTGISAFAYPKLVKSLGLPSRRPRVHDVNQMLAMPDMDVLDALGCDVVTVFGDATNAFDEPQKWQDYDFNGRLQTVVRNKSIFKDQPDGSITQPLEKSLMLANAYVFDVAHGGSPLDLAAELPKPDLKQVKADLVKYFPTDEYIGRVVELCKTVRNSTDKAIFLNGPIYTGMSIGWPGGLAVWPVLCLIEPNYVADYHGLMTENALKLIDIVAPAVADNVDVIMLSSDDWGSQQNLFAPPSVFENLFVPQLKKINASLHRHAPNVKTFLHSCGAIYNILDMIIDSGFDVLNPVQWPAGGHGYQKWKDKCRNRIALWGGGVDSQITLPFGTVEEVAAQTKEVVQYLKQDSGYVFCSIHNILAEIEPEKIIAMYKSAANS